MHASLIKIIELFEGIRQNAVPLFHRPYVWGKSHWQRLWNDLMACCETQNPLATTHFLGTIVTLPIKSATQVEKYLIIDGQQRLTTIALLLIALRSYVNYSQKRVVSNYLENSHVANGASTDGLKLLPPLCDQQVFTSLVKNTMTPPGSKMEEAVGFFQKAIRRGHGKLDLLGPGGLLDVITSCLTVVSIQLSENDDPYLVFESLNQPGQPMRDVDFIRDLLFAKFNEDTDSELSREKIFQNVWSPMVAMLGLHLSEFFRQYLMLLEGREIQCHRVYSEFSRKFGGLAAPEMLNMLKHCLTLAGFFHRLINPENEVDPALREALLSLKKLGASAACPLLFCLFNARHLQQITHEDLLKSLALIEALFVRRAVCELDVDAEMFREMAKHFSVTDQTAAAYLSACLARNSNNYWRCPDDQEFVEALVSSHPFDKELAGFILAKIELMLGTEPSEVHANIQVEPIVAPTDKSFGQWMMRLGNLAIAEARIRSAGSSFPAKKPAFERSPFATNRSIARAADWTKEEVRQRGHELAGFARQRWPVLLPVASLLLCRFFDVFSEILV